MDIRKWRIIFTERIKQKINHRIAHGAGRRNPDSCNCSKLRRLKLKVQTAAGTKVHSAEICEGFFSNGFISSGNPSEKS